MLRKRTPRPLVIERWTPPLSEKEVRQALGGQHKHPIVRATEDILSTRLAEIRTQSNDPTLADSVRHFYAGWAAGLEDLLIELREHIGADNAGNQI